MAVCPAFCGKFERHDDPGGRKIIEPVYHSDAGSIYHGHVLDVLPALPEKSVQCCVTSPPYWGLRDYGLPPMVWGGDPECRHDFGLELVHTEVGRGNWAQAVNGRGEPQGDPAVFREPIRAKAERGFCRKCGAWMGCYGLEPTPALYIQHTVEIFRAVRRVLADDGILWLNLGDSYAAGTRDYNSFRRDRAHVHVPNMPLAQGLKPKDLVGMPWRVALALQDDGWYLRADIIWEKPNCMPESCKDRPTKSHEYIFLLSKKLRYYYDNEAIKEPSSPNTHARYARGRSGKHKWADGGPGNQSIAKKAAYYNKFPTGWDSSQGSHRKRAGRYKNPPGVNPKAAAGSPGSRQNASFSAAVKDIVKFRNKRTVWRVPAKGFKGAHFATFPVALIEPCILAGCPGGGTVLDPFFGAGTTGVACHELGRKFLGVELGRHYIDEITVPRIKQALSQRNIYELAPLEGRKKHAAK